MNARIVAGLLLAVPLLAQAVEATPTAAAITEPGTTERDQQEVLTWLELQASGKAASPYRQSATPAERDRAYQRYLKSYTREMPEYLLDDGDFKVGNN
ncbi:DUF3613 domain-containing protein [Pseudomonas sp. ZM23]|uniref:DUF3613 domain-containing protein n=1 Tax=Pseudomonas triclosanedens TaxID=2961893 RepID=A0ABY7A0T1_9PSED|nr:DUF3613 domain-containing protein [Pseudomonas triclosanedens]MCP8464697.1 DUF3613 domain-containing protein [Pseudomonas triclosanedens]MCP8473628.1 DUF3613 domain-containing protein [Pseudomonas triclosanedens]MCP8478465.1 DUF3613 domain-containing protein [Pseudomonas triclosanedens]WAI50822.1 DUF3613 domain-containing protein [Pseudomonas triclosanedens]